MEELLVQEDDRDLFQDEEEQLASISDHKSKRQRCFHFLWEHKSRVGILSAVLFLLLWWVLLKTTDNACDASLSPAYSQDRQVNKKMCSSHVSEDLSRTEATDAFNNDDDDGVDSLDFAVLGNFGRDGFCCQLDVALELQRHLHIRPTQFVLNPGNAFYPAGIKHANDAQVRTSWKDVYTPRIPWYSTRGEAEAKGDIEALKELSSLDEFFIFEDLYYEKFVFSKNKTFSVHLIFIDTPSLLRSKEKQNDPQLLWLRERMELGNTSTIIVVGFHSPHSDQNLVKFLVPVLENESKPASIYFSGRERTLQWFQAPSTHYFVSGAGAQVLYGEKPFKEARDLYAVREEGFLACSITMDADTKIISMKTAMVNRLGKMVKLIQSPIH